MIVRVNINITDINSEPEPCSERLSQALFNELLEVLDKKDGHYKVKSWDNYRGWIAAHFVIEHDGFNGSDCRIVVSNLASGLEEPDGNSKKIAFLPYGCRLYGSIKSGFLRVSSEKYGEIYVKDSDLIKTDKSQNKNSYSNESLISEAEKFLSVPYLWGGRSFFGIDCSGFVQTIFRRFGIDLPRDSNDQIKRGAEIKRGQIELGDLLFFPRHVALAVSGTRYIHSSSGNGGVAYNCFDKDSKEYNQYLDDSFICARRIVE